MKANLDINHLEMREVHLTCPVKPEKIAQLRLGDLVYLNGLIYTGREGLYERMIGQGLDLPVPIQTISNANFHCSPAATTTEDGYLVRAVTATASFRYSKWMEAFFKKSDCKLIIGKGGMTSAAYQKLFVPAGAIYLTTVGYGLGATYGRAIKKVKDVYWLAELGIAQAIWILEVEAMGPFIVESDPEGHSLFELCNEKINENLSSLYEGLPEPALRRFGEALDRDEEVV